MSNFLVVLSAFVLIAVVIAVTWPLAFGRGYRKGHKDGWNQYADRLQEKRAFWGDHGEAAPSATSRRIPRRGARRGEQLQ